MIHAISDLHCDRPSRMDATIELTRHPRKGTLIIAGDFGDLECLALFEGFNPKIAVLGNHDIWTTKGSSQDKAKQAINRLKEYNFHVLDEAPFIDGKIAYVGGIGWYDYSLFRKEYFPEVTGWSQDKIQEYLCKNKYLIWNDARFAKWGKTDIEKTDELVEKLDKDLESVTAKVDSIIVVMHHLPFDSIVLRMPESKAWECCNAYMGSKKFGEVIERYDKAKTVITGHQHRTRRIKEKKIDCYTVALNPRHPEFTSLNNIL